ncbi:flagellar hook-length control protein FliK [Legionella pneumophila]|nr:flagellar hook-length control protein FliK [Legionella pneumophila]
MGPLEINVKVVKDNASVNISTHSVYVKEIVDQAIPRLREMMAQQGINLSEVHMEPIQVPAKVRRKTIMLK